MKQILFALLFCGQAFAQQGGIGVNSTRCTVGECTLNAAPFIPAPEHDSKSFYYVWEKDKGMVARGKIVPIPEICIFAADYFSGNLQWKPCKAP